jgi:sarcosine oxidase
MTDVAVVGLGAMGSMALWRLAERGAAAVGVDRFDPPHDRGSSHGESRLIRTAYAEGAWYVPLMHEGWRLWRELEALSGVELLTTTGALMVVPRDGELLSGALASAREHELEHEILDATAASRRWPQHVLGVDDHVLYEPAAGVLRPEACIGAALARARSLGATTRTSTRVTAIETHGDSTVLRLDDGDTIHTRRCIVAAGSWTGMMLPELAAQLRVERQLTAWFEVNDPRAFAPLRFTVFMSELAAGRLS